MFLMENGKTITSNQELGETLKNTHFSNIVLNFNLGNNLDYNIHRKPNTSNPVMNPVKNIS